MARPKNPSPSDPGQARNLPKSAKTLPEAERLDCIAKISLENFSFGTLPSRGGCLGATRRCRFSSFQQAASTRKDNIMYLPARCELGTSRLHPFRAKIITFVHCLHATEPARTGFREHARETLSVVTSARSSTLSRDLGCPLWPPQRSFP